MWIYLKKYIGEDLQIIRKALVGVLIKKEMKKKDKMDIGTPVWRVVLFVNGFPSPIAIDCPTEDHAIQVVKDIRDI